MPGANGSSRSKQSGACTHIDASESALKRYALGLKWGRKIKRGEVKRDEDDEDGNQDDSFDRYDDDAKRRKVNVEKLASLDGLLTSFVCLAISFLPIRAAPTANPHFIDPSCVWSVHCRLASIHTLTVSRTASNFI